MRGSLGELARMPGMPSEPVLRKLIDTNPDFPIITRGSNGVAYEIELEQAFAYVRGIEEAKRAAVAARDEEVRQLGLQLLGDDAEVASAPALTAADHKAVIEAELAAIKLAQARRELVRWSGVAAAVNEFVMFVAERQSTLADRLSKRADISRDALHALERLIDQDRRDVAARMEMMKDACAGDQDGDPGFSVGR